MSDVTNTSTENTNSTTDSLVAQVQKELDKARMEGVKARLKTNVTQINELRRQITALEQANQKLLDDFKAGL